MDARVMALDLGERRIGVALSDPAGRIALPLTVLDTDAVLRDGAPLRALIEDYEVGLVVVGLPVTLSGEESRQSERVRSISARLARFLPVPLVFADERYSSAEAARRGREAGLSSKAMRGRLDAVAASLVLQAWLDARTGSDVADED